MGLPHLLLFLLVPWSRGKPCLMGMASLFLRSKDFMVVQCTGRTDSPAGGMALLASGHSPTTWLAPTSTVATTSTSCTIPAQSTDTWKIQPNTWIYKAAILLVMPNELCKSIQRV